MSMALSQGDSVPVDKEGHRRPEAGVIQAASGEEVSGGAATVERWRPAPGCGGRDRVQ
jgi:hypothetical protein